MKIVKLFLSIVVAFVLAVLIIALIVPGEFAVKKEIVIGKNKSEVFKYIKLLKNQNNYSVWAQMDPTMKREYRGVDGTKGFVSEWESENKQVGKGEQEILSVVAGERIDTEIRFSEPFQVTNYAYMKLERVSDEKMGDNTLNNATKVSWGFRGKMPYPLNVFLLVMDVDKEIGTDLEQGLVNLKRILEK